MTPAPRPRARSRRLLAHGLGLGLLAGGVVLGAQGPAQAIQYLFADGSGNTTNGLQLSFVQDGFLGADAAGNASVTGSFDLTGGNLTILDDIEFGVASSNGPDTISATFSDGYYDAANNILYFGITSGACPGGTNFLGFFTGPNCLELRLADDAIENGAATAQFVSGTNALGDYLNSGNDSAGFFGFIPFDLRDRDLTLVAGQLLQVPTPVSALALLPLAGLKRYRRRVQRLSQAREAARSAAELG